MNKKNTERLFKKYPEFFKYRDDMMASLMCFGFECGDGWYDLIFIIRKIRSRKHE